MKLLLLFSLASMVETSIPVTHTSPNPTPAPLYVKADNIIQYVNASTHTLKAGTPVVVEIPQTYTSKNLTEGQTVSVRVKYNVVVAKKTLIAAGAMGNAVVSSITKPGIFGRAGKIELQVQSVQAVDGQQILLSGMPISVDGQNKKGLAWGVSAGLFILTIIGGAFGFFIKGKHAELKVGTTSNTTVASDAQIEAEPESN